ncbi:MAG: HipA N-terminal domain-containing protein [Fibrobacterota bacterium]|nr:HipA N-terminal domain-containing protein [Fibrobacterota bacterium]
MRSRQAQVYLNAELAGTLTETQEGYLFAYNDRYYLDGTKPAISLTFPKSTKEYRSKTLFPFFYGLLAEGENKSNQCRNLKIDEKDHFTRLLKTAHTETIGAVTVRDDHAHP